MAKFKFDLKQNVRIAASGEQGVILGRAEYTHSDNSYYVRYKAADGRATEAWWSQGALAAVVPVKPATPKVKVKRALKTPVVKPAPAAAAK